MATVAELQNELQRQGRGPGACTAARQSGSNEPSGSSRLPRTALAELAPDRLPSGSEQLAQRARDLRTEAVTASQQAAARRTSALTTLGGITRATLRRCGRTMARTRPVA